MAKILLINSVTENPPYNNIGDIVGIFDDSHQFSDIELIEFTAIIIQGSVEDLFTRFRSIAHEERFIYKKASTGEWSFVHPEIEDLEAQRKVWKNKSDNKWYYLDKPYKFGKTVANLIPQELVAIASTDILDPSVDSVYEKVQKDPSDEVENTTEISGVGDIP